MTTLSKKEVFKMSILTIQQVHQNNLVAKEFLMCIIREKQSYAEDKAFKKRLFNCQCKKRFPKTRTSKAETTGQSHCPLLINKLITKKISIIPEKTSIIRLVI